MVLKHLINITYRSTFLLSFFLTTGVLCARLGGKEPTKINVPLSCEACVEGRLKACVSRYIYEPVDVVANATRFTQPKCDLKIVFKIHNATLLAVVGSQCVPVVVTC